MSDGVAPGVRWSVDLPAGGGGSIQLLQQGLLITGRSWVGLWSYDGAQSWVETSKRDLGNAPVLLDERTFAVIEEQQVVIREIATGRVSVRWSAPGSSRLVLTPWGDLMFLEVGRSAGRITRIMRCVSRDGRPRWSTPLSSDPPDFPWPAFAVGEFIVLGQGGALRAYDEKGTQRWVAGHDGMRDPATPGKPVSLRGSAITVDRNRVLVELDWYNGIEFFEVDGRGPSIRPLGERVRMRFPTVTVPGIDDHYLIAGSLGQADIGHMDYVYPLRLQRRDGSIVWEHRVHAKFDGLSAVPDGGFVVTGSPSLKVWEQYGQWQDLSDRTFAQRVDASGNEVWTWYAPSLVSYTGVADSDGTVYTGSDGKLFALVAEEVKEAEDDPGPPAVPLARTSHEAQVYLDLTACECGEGRLPRSSTTIELPDGELGSRYTGTCPSCGTERTYVFRLPEISEDVSTEDEIVYGLGTRPSELLDAAQWLSVADRYAAAVPSDPERLEGQQRRVAKSRLMAAVAAVWEAEKFVPDLGERVPDSALWSDLGRQMLTREPGRFDAARMALRREAYERVLRAVSPRPKPVFDEERQRRLSDPGYGTDPVSGLYLDSAAGALAAYRQLCDRISTGWVSDLGERDRRLALAAGVYAGWREREAIDDSAWTADVWSIPAALLPPAASAWAMVRAARTAAGMD